jgi:hypothetical protein
MRVIDRGCLKAGPCALRIVIAVLVCALAGCSFLCQDTLVSKHNSPDGRFVAVVFHRNCGATTPFTTEISVTGSGDDVSGGSAGNIFSMTDPPGSTETLSRNGVIEVRLNWRSPQLLLISTPQRAVVGKRVNRFDDINPTFAVGDI